MPVPYMAGALRGWTKPTVVKLITQTVVDHETVETPTDITLDVNFQPMPAATVNRKPPEQRTWKWWSIIVKKGQLLKTDDIIITASSQRFKIQSANDWSESGFTKYEAIEDYEAST